MGANARRKKLAREQQKQQEQQKGIKLPEKKEDKIGPKIPPIPGALADNPGLKMAAQAAEIITHIQGKKVIAFLQENFDCCSEKCILEYTELFQKDNYACLLVPRPNYKDILKYLASYVVLFRTGNKDASIEEVKTIVSYVSHLKNLGIRVVYYMDDMLFWANNNAPLILIKASDAVIVANETLKQVLQTKGQVNKPIIVVPTHLQLNHFDKRPAIPPIPLSQKFKILLTSQGRIGINHTYEICEIVNEDPELATTTEWIFNASGVAQVRSVINRFRNIHKTYVDWISLAEYYSLAKSVDLIIHPAKPDDLNYMCPPDMQQSWLDCKCEVKYTLAGAARIPIISSPTASYVKAIKDGETGFLANTAEEFVAKIRELKDNPALRHRIGTAARSDIEQNYDVKIRYPQYRDAIIGKVQPDSISVIHRDLPTKLGVFIPPIEGGPRTFYENMKRWLPRVSKDKWEVVENLTTAKAAIAIAFVMADDIIQEKKKRSDLKVLYRLDGLPMDFAGNIEPTNLAKMQELFDYSDGNVWQSLHCLNMWRSKNLIPEKILHNPTGPIIHNGVDLEIFCPDGPKYSFPASRKYNFLNLNWSTFPHKRIDLLREIIKSYESNSDVRFYLIGNYVSTSQIANVGYWQDSLNVTYLGQMRNQSLEAKKMLASIYRVADALLFTSEMEGSPNTVLEATGCGCPTVYNPNVDIVPEILGDACLPIELIDRIFDPTARKDIQVKLSSIAPKYSMEECCKKYLEIFNEGRLV